MAALDIRPHSPRISGWAVAGLMVLGVGAFTAGMIHQIAPAGPLPFPPPQQVTQAAPAAPDPVLQYASAERPAPRAPRPPTIAAQHRGPAGAAAIADDAARTPPAVDASATAADVRRRRSAGSRRAAPQPRRQRRRQPDRRADRALQPSPWFISRSGASGHDCGLRPSGGCVTCRGWASDGCRSRAPPAEPPAQGEYSAPGALDRSGPGGRGRTHSGMASWTVRTGQAQLRARTSAKSRPSNGVLETVPQRRKRKGAAQRKAMPRKAA